MARRISRQAKRVWLGEDLNDLFQLARLGLVKAARTFDPSRGSFLAYGSLYARGEIARAMRRRGLLAVDLRKGKRWMPTVASLDALAVVKRITPDTVMLRVLDRNLELAEQRADIQTSLKSLPKREQVVVFFTYVYPFPQTRIAKLLRVSQRHVSRLLARFHQRHLDSGR